MLNIPNLITLTNLLAGSLACLSVLWDDHSMAFTFLFIALACDLADGFAARLTNSETNIGKELDSLADMVSFGFLPGLMAFKGMQETLNEWNHSYWFAGFAFILTLGAALRLAKFNTSHLSGVYFYGLPTPSMTIAIAGMYLHSIDFYIGQPVFNIPTDPLMWWIAIPLVTVLMHLPTPMFSLKVGSRSTGEIGMMIIFFILGVVLFFLFNTAGLVLIIGFYVLLSQVHWMTNRDTYEVQS
jgi:CDP-diacylglycerol--serine O-phosphatidyltransferase